MTITMSDPFDALHSSHPVLSPPYPSFPSYSSSSYLPDLPSLSPYASSSSSQLTMDSAFPSGPSPFLLPLVTPSLSMSDFPPLPAASHTGFKREAMRGGGDDDDDDADDGDGDEDADADAEDGDAMSGDAERGYHALCTSAVPSSVASSSQFSSASAVSASGPSSSSFRSAGSSTARPPAVSGVAGGGGGTAMREAVERRVSKACCNCSISKTKCDNNRPCGRCVRTDRTATCSDPVRKRRGRKRPYESAQPVSAATLIPAGQQLDVEQPQAAVVAAAVHPSKQSTPTSSNEPFAAVNTAPRLSTAPSVAEPLDYAQSHPSTANAIAGQHPNALHTAHYTSVVHQASRGVHMHSPQGHNPSHSSHPHAGHAVTPGPAAAYHHQHNGVHRAPLLASSSASHPSSPSSSSSGAPIAPTPRLLPISTMLSRLRVRIPSTLHRSFDAVVQQFHRWADAITKAKQAQQPAPTHLLKARQYLFHTLTNAMLYLEENHALKPSATSPSPAFISRTPSSADQRVLLSILQHEWGAQLYAPASSSGAEYCPRSLSDGSPLSLDDLLQHNVAAPTFIIPLLSFPFFLTPPLVSRSFCALLGFSHAALMSFVHTPLDLLSLRQYPDVALLVPAFLSALSARADHYLHSSGWRRSDGSYVQLVAKVQLCYSKGVAGGGGEGYPVALYATFQKQENSSFAQHVLLAQQQQQQQQQHTTAGASNQGAHGRTS